MSEEYNDRGELEETDALEVEETEATVEKVPAKTGKKPEPAKTEAKKKVRKKSRIARWFREMRSELKKVVWPTPKQIKNNTGIAVVVMIACGVVIWAVDQVGAQIFRMLITLGS